MQGREAFEFRGTKRFEVRRRIGAGGMGIVYEAFDRDTNQPVALKTLRHLDAQALYRLKNEFRALQDLRHPHLVQLGELIEDRGKWFFTMELVNGVDFLTHVYLGGGDARIGNPPTIPGAPHARERLQLAQTGRLSKSSEAEVLTADGLSMDVEPDLVFDEERLRSALVGLALGVQALHEAGMVHRDIKPSNILVTREGRVVLLDFGLVTEHTQLGKSSESQVVGTAAYMAPEQAAAKRAGPAADWHSVGVVLYEAMTGRLPFTGSSIEILMDKQRHDPPPPRSWAPLVPPDLDELCTELLRFDPDHRPHGSEILRRLGVDEVGPAQTISSTSHGSGGQPFLGRDDELALLRDAWEASRQAQPVTVYIHGESGVGKSALIKRFTRQIEARNPDAVVLSGRCYERESMHYKAFDGVIDELSRYMRRLDDREVGTLLPRNAALLPRVFPVLGRVEVIAQAPQPRQAVKDPRELRTRVFAALRELLSRIAERHPLVVTIDDLHWADADSSLLLSELLRQPDAPPILLMVSSRQKREPEPRIPGDVRRIALGALDPDSARQLAKLLLRRAAPGKKFSPSEIAVDARGNPLFIDQLVRHAATSEPGARARHHLDEVIWKRVADLPDEAIFVLELVCVAGRPLYQSAFAHASRMDPGDFARHVALLRVANLVRGRRDGEFETLEPYHDRVQEAVLQKLDDETRRKRHARLALALEGAGATRLHPQLVLRHFEAAGDLDKATDCALEAADRAAGALAFDRAVDFYETSLRLAAECKAPTKPIRVKLGDALVNAGRGAEAADVFLEAARDAGPSDRIEYQRRATEQLLTTGHVDRGLEALEKLLGEIGVEMPPTPKKAARSLVWHRIKLRLRGLGWTEKLPEEIPDRALLELDVYKTAAHGLALVDAIRGADFQTRGLLLALKTGERERVGLFMTTEAIQVAAQGPRSVPRARKLLEQARRIAQDSASHYLITWTVLARGFLRYFEEQYSTAAELLSEVEHKILDEATGMTWELSSCRMFRMFALRQIGDFHELRRCYDDYTLDAAQRGDLYTETGMRLFGSVVWLAADEPERGAEKLSETSWTPPGDGMHLQHWWQIEALGELGLYRGRAAEALRELEEACDRLERSHLLRLQSLRINYLGLRARLLVAAARETGDAGRLGDVDRLARKLLRERTDFSRVKGLLLRAASETQRGEHARSLESLREVVRIARAGDLALYGDIAQHWEGTLIGGDAGRELAEQAEEHLRACGVADPVAFARMLAPGLET